MLLNIYHSSNRIVSNNPTECSFTIDPQKVHQHATTSYQVTNQYYKRVDNSRLLPNAVKARLSHQFFRLEPFIKNSFNYGPKDIWAMPTYIKISNFIDESKVQNTNWYEILSRELEGRGYARHKDNKLSSTTEIKEFLLFYRRNVVFSLQKDGFKKNDPILEMPTVLIDKNKKILKGSKGNHRFAIAKKLGMENFPVVICGTHKNVVNSLGTTKKAIRKNLRQIKKCLTLDDKLY